MAYQKPAPIKIDGDTYREACYIGRNTYERPHKHKDDFKTFDEFEAYCRGRRHQRQDEQLDADTEWD